MGSEQQSFSPAYMFMLSYKDHSYTLNVVIRLAKNEGSIMNAIMDKLV